MSRRKQSKPRQIKRSLGDLDVGEDNTPDNVSLSGDEGGASDPEDSGECDSSSPPPYTPLYTEEPRTHDSHDSDDGDLEEKGPTHNEEEEEMEEEEDRLHWSGPDDLGLSDDADDPKVLARRDLLSDTLWGPCSGSVQSQEPGEDPGPRLSKGSRLILVCEDADCWISRVPITCDASEANCSIYSQGKELYCKVTRDISTGDCLVAMLSLSSPKKRSPSQSQGMEVKEEPTGVYPAALHSEIQLLPQQAGMAAILATAVVNKDIFPCKDCGIWYRSERNLQAHLMYYCASRQKHQAPSSPPQDKPKESYPNERVCPFPQCNKSCPSASSLEIHMRTHSGERPFVCLICLSAFTTKANCERHLKVHTDTQNGVCHGCGFVSTTRDILYSHLVTSHMVCQPGSRSEVYSPGPGLPKLPLSTGLSPGDSGVVLKCQVCGHITDSPAQLQQHVRTHLDVRVPADRSPTPRQSTPPSGDLPEPPACLPHPDSSSPGANGSSATPRDCSPADRLPADVRIKKEPCSDSEDEGREEKIEVGGDGKRQEKRQGHAGTASSQTSTSPRSPSAVPVKAEPTSPTPGSSPAHIGGAASVLPGGTVFLPQYMFSPEVAILPQASEILAKMSEMVHSRLKQGQVAPGAAATFYPAGTTGTVHKGATCFECDITFNNINNFYVHKRLYCSSRHQQGDQASGAVKDGAPGASIPSVGHSSSPPAGSGSRAASASPSDTGPVPGSTATEGPLLEVKTENPGPKETVLSSSSEGEGGTGGQASEGSQSPSGSTEDPEDDPTRTFCQACNIHFSRHENYTVHKRFYCASRHDPSNQRSSASKAAFLPQPIRTRKRKKMYEIHMARTEALANAAAATVPGLRLAVKQEATASVGRVLEAPVPAPNLHPATSRSTSPDGDGPIDLSKRPRLRETPRSGSIPALPLTDYHKCTACSISFNSIENYLAHKTYYCPATTLQPHTLETLHRLKRPTSTSPKSKALERPDLHLDAKGLPTEKAPQGALPSPHSSSLPGSEATSPHSGPTATKGPGSPSVVCPYCPPNVVVTCDLVEHFRSIHGLVLSVEGQHAVVSPSLSPREATPTTPPKTALRTRRESINGRVRRDTVSPSSPLVNGSPLGPHAVGNSSPKAAPPAMSPIRATPMTVSPVPEVLREVGVLNHQAAVTLLPDKTPLSLGLPLAVPAPPTHKAPLVSPVQNGNSRFCRLCNIKFSSLSTFIAHKKYYCSSHSAEHVK